MSSSPETAEYADTTRQAGPGGMFSAIILIALTMAALAMRTPLLFRDANVTEAAVKAQAVCLDTERDTSAVSNLAASAAAAPGPINWLVSSALLCKGDKLGSNQALRRMIAASPDRIALARDIAHNNIALARYAAERYPDNGTAYAWLGDAQVLAGNSDEAQAAYERSTILEPKDADAWLALGKLYENASSMAQAAEAYDQACLYVDHPKNGCPSAGRVHLKLGEYEQAIASFTRSIQQIGYFWPESEQGLVDALLALGRKEEAIPHLQALADNGSQQARKQLDELRSDR